MHVALIVITLLAQATTTPTPLPPGITRLDGKDAPSGIQYALISVEGKLTGPAAQVPSVPPTLTAQCTQTPDGKQKFELLANLGGVTDLAFYPPWHQTREDLYPPILQRATVTMEFLGYTRVKPVKRQWEYLAQSPNEMRYATPGMASANMESISFYMQYLKALPLLRLTVPGKGTVEFETSKWQTLIRAEPLCRQSAL